MLKSANGYRIAELDEEESFAIEKPDGETEGGVKDGLRQRCVQKPNLICEKSIL